MKKRIIAMVLSVAMMLTMFPTGVLADDFDYDEGNTAGVTVGAEGQSDENQGEGESASIVSEEPAPAETEDQTTEPVESESQTTDTVESASQATDSVESTSQATEPATSESQATEPVESESQAAEPVESESQTTDPAASASQAAEPEEKDNSVNTADLYDPQPTDITAEQTTINVGQPLGLTGKSVGGRYDTPVHEWSTKDAAVATVAGNGSKATVTGVGVGEAEISHHYYYKDWFGNKKGENTETIKIKVVAKVIDAAIQVTDDASATSVTFSKYATPPVLKAVVVNPTDAEYKSCAWSVNNSDVLEVNPQTGAITAKGAGDATVTLTVKNHDNSEVKATLPVTVTNPIPTSAEITVKEGNVDDLYPQDTLTLVPGVEPGSADEYNCAWESSDAEVATVAGDATKATVTAVKDGTATITLTVTPKSAEAAASADEASPAAEPVKAELEVTVKAVTPAESVTIRSDKTEVPVRGTVQFTATVNPTGAQGSYEWNTDKRQVLSIDKNGLATGEAAGTANVTVTFKGKDGKEITSEPIQITVTPAAQQYKREALVYYLKDPTKDANSNASDQWGPGSLGTATVDVAGATWANDKNCFNVKGRVISWPEGYGDGVVPRNTNPGSVWMTIFASYQESVQKELKRTITTDDVEEIWLEPAKISKDNGTTPDMHLDCNVKIKCRDIVMVSFKVQDVNDPTAIQVKAMNRVANSTVSATDVPSYPATKENGKYDFRGWYLNSDFSGNKITFESDYQLGKDNVTFYGRYVQRHTVTYKLDENAANAYATENVYADDTHTVIAAPTKDGFEFTGWKLDESTTYQPGNTFKMPDSDVTLVAQWKATTRSYTVNYYWNGTTTKVAEPSTGTANVGEKIENLEPVPVEGYTPVSTESKSITIDEDATKNVITFFYYKDVTLTANSNENPYIYDGEEKTVTGYKTSDDAATFEGIAASGTGTNAGTHKVTFTENPVGKTSTDGKYIVTKAEPGTLTINKRNVTLKSADLDKKYDGNALKNGNAPLAVEDGFVEGEGATYAFTGSQTLVGSSDNEFTYTLNEGTDAGNYTINTQFGKLKVTDREEGDKLEITVEANSDSKPYDGQPLTVNGFKTLSFEVEGNTYTVEGLTATATGTDVADSKVVEVKGTAKVLDVDGNDVTAQFKVKTKNGQLTISPVAIELTANSNSKAYDGKALTDSGYKITNGNFVGEEGLESVTVEGSQTLVGSSDNTIKAHTLKDNTKAENYSISYKNGKLTVTDRTDAEKYQITVEAKSNSKPYDGQSLTVEGFKTLNFEVNGNTYTVEGLSATATGTNVSDSKAVEVKGIAKVLDASKNDVTAQFKVETKNGQLTISPKEITVTAENKSKTYGDTDPKLTATATGLVGEDTVDYTLSRDPGEDVGEYAITVTGDEVQGNYKVSFADGKLVITPKNIVPGDNNKDLTATAPKDVVYSGESQQQKPEVKDGDKVLEEGKDYTLTYSEDTTNAGPVTVTITGKGNYGSKFEVTYQITPAPLKITTNSAEKTYDGSALTADGKIEGVVERDKNDVKLNITGSQTEVGESKNTYKIEWGNAKASNYEITEDIGTLKVNARSGGGSSSKPTPEDEPTPTPTPTPLPTLPTTPAPTTPTRRVTRSTATVTEPASRPTEQITENETPKAESEPEVIEDEETPLAPMAGGAWALVNLILMLLTVLASLLLLLGYLGKKKYAKEDEYGNALHDANGNEIIDYTRNKKGFWRVASLIPAIAAAIAFALTENMRLPMVMTDRWTLLMVIIAVVQLIVAVLCKKKKESEEDENQANA